MSKLIDGFLQGFVKIRTWICVMLMHNKNGPPSSLFKR